MIIHNSFSNVIAHLNFEDASLNVARPNIYSSNRDPIQCGVCKDVAG